jgi:alkanesulfonate monooxygenase SsuD/methylene tetrahydromethanopterin reductase-like flavin-dependent oxidoreductase (luciferase family)
MWRCEQVLVERKITSKNDFGWRIPEFPVNGMRKQEFVSQILRALRKVESSFDSAWLSDHMIPWADWQSRGTDNLEGWTTVNYLIGVFKRLTFGHIVLCNSYRNPVLLAKMIANLSSFCPGRFILGIGAGWKQDEYVSYGYVFPKPSARIGALQEAVQIIRKMWTEDVVSFHGKYYVVDHARCSPKPKPIPPIMIGGGGEKLTPKVVAEHADWWNCPNLTLDQYKHKLGVLKRYCEKAGRNYLLIRKTWLGCIAISRSQDKASEIASNNAFTANDQEAMDAAIIGTPERVSHTLTQFVDLGVDYFILRFLDFPSTTGLDLFTHEVIPRFT